MAEPRVPHWHVFIEPPFAEMMSIRNFEIGPALLRDSLGYRLLIREQTSGELLVLGVTATHCFLITHLLRKGLAQLGLFHKDENYFIGRTLEAPIPKMSALVKKISPFSKRNNPL